MPLQPHARLGPYEILERIGAGGMGEVYRARHTRLDRDVAIKVLPASVAADRHHLRRFEREARSASALNHPNIVTIHDIAEHDGITYIAMELVRGRTLKGVIGGRQLPLAEVMRIAIQTLNGLANAHAAGIVHRDLKPGNVMLTETGLVKILDFGLAKPLARDVTQGGITEQTREGIVVGTPHYMSPEQATAGTVDPRSDQFAFGVLLYEMLVGRPPFDGPSLQSVLTAVVTQPAPRVRAARPDVPAALERVLQRCLEKDPAQRFASTDDLLDGLRSAVPARRRRLAATIKRPVAAVPLALAVVAIALGAWTWTRSAERRWAETSALREVTDHIERGNVYLAYHTASLAEKHRANDPALRKLIERVTLPVIVTSVPPGAEVWVTDYRTPTGEWRRLGRTPLETRVPYAMMRWRIVKPGFEPFEGAPFSTASIAALERGILLDSVGKRPPGMVRVPAGPASGIPTEVRLPASPMQLETYYLDRHEVSNAEYAEFVAADGYAQSKHWPELTRGASDAPPPFAVAMERFRDSTGRAGPSTWSVGRFPAGQDSVAVGGISWFEAAAYCAWAGKSLPTLYHWTHAIGQEQLSDILLHSNSDGSAAAPRGRFAGVAAYGAYDMAGNVREWVWNASADKRLLLGGSWTEPAYRFRAPHAADAWSRDPANGVRCAKYVAPIADVLLAPIELQPVLPQPVPISDEAFALVRGVYAYDRTPLEPEQVGIDDSNPDYRHEIVSVKAAYGSEHMRINLLLPRDAPPPWQAVIWFPGADVFALRRSPLFSSAYLFDFLPRAGRAVVYPVYDGMHDRYRERPMPPPPAYVRDITIHRAQDIGRAIDYLETRRDFDVSKIAYYGFSGGALSGPIFAAVEPRIKAAILLGGGLTRQRRQFRPENHPVHFAPRSSAATLMINGRDDFLLSYESSQLPLFELLGAPPERKKLARLEGGHIPTNRVEIIREVLDWLDRHLGPVPASGKLRQASGTGPN